MTNEVKQQFTLRITQANATELVVILYEMTLLFLQEAKEAGEKQDWNEYKEAIRKTRNCINELLQSLHMEYEPAKNLFKLYMFCIRRLAYAQVRKEVQVLDEIESVLSKLKSAYAQIAPNNSSAPVMSNTQTVYSGLTYGKSAVLAEDVTGHSANRGMFV
ncbi:MAG: flagellar export chaperone FliS [Lachnospiraceae bacterium]|nr:flagellar export chaperone FliS [Lachnospiraceae bacterium]MBQ7777248.1 flagellar export chaperone FliS [Lachnospiraceae bacterium]